MSKQPERGIRKTQEIAFPNGNRAYVVFLSLDMPPQTVLPFLHLPEFHDFIMLAGGAAHMTQALSSTLRHFFVDGIAQLAASRTMLIIDGGTQSGAMELMGMGVTEQQHRFPLLGIAPAGCVRYPGQSAYEDNNDADATPLDSNHTHFVLVKTDTWGGETATMYALAHHFSQRHSSIAVLVNGGAIAIHEVLYNVRQKRPIIVLEGSGRASDDIAHLWREKPPVIDNPELAEIIQHGNIHLFPVTGSVENFVSMMRTMIPVRA